MRTRYECDGEIRIFDTVTKKRYLYKMHAAVNADDDGRAAHRIAELLELETAVSSGRSIRRENSHDMHERAAKTAKQDQA